MDGHQGLGWWIAGGAFQKTKVCHLRKAFSCSQASNKRTTPQHPGLLFNLPSGSLATPVILPFLQGKFGAEFGKLEQILSTLGLGDATPEGPGGVFQC
jgi:hypothetical protein